MPSFTFADVPRPSARVRGVSVTIPAAVGSPVGNSGPPPPAPLELVGVPVPLSEYASSDNGAAIDCRNRPARMMATQMVQIPTPDTQWSVRFQQSADGLAGWTDIPGGAFQTVEVSTASERIYFTRSQRYVRAVWTAGGAAPQIITGALLLA